MNILENIKYYAATSESRIAIKSGDSVLTYKQLEEYSNRLAAWINRNLSSNKVPIVVYGHKNPYMVVCFLACVKSGRAYCPHICIRIIDVWIYNGTNRPSEMSHSVSCANIWEKYWQFCSSC